MWLSFLPQLLESVFFFLSILAGFGLFNHLFEIRGDTGTNGDKFIIWFHSGLTDCALLGFLVTVCLDLMFSIQTLGGNVALTSGMIDVADRWSGHCQDWML